MDGKEIFKEILKSPQMKELLGVSPGEEIHEDYLRFASEDYR